MNARNMSQVKREQLMKYSELGAYVVLASGFIGHVLFLEGQISASNIVLIAIGIIFGAMASMSWSPFTERLSDSVALDLAEVFSFKTGGSENADSLDDKRAA